MGPFHSPLSWQDLPDPPEPPFPPNCDSYSEAFRRPPEHTQRSNIVAKGSGTMAVLREANFASIDDLSIPDTIDEKRIARLRANGHSHQADIESNPERLRIAHVDQVIGEYKLDHELRDALREHRTCTPKLLDCADFSPENALLDIEDTALASGHFDELLLMQTIDKVTGSTIWILLGVVASQSYILAQQYDDSQPTATVLTVKHLRSRISSVTVIQPTLDKATASPSIAFTLSKHDEKLIHRYTHRWRTSTKYALVAWYGFTAVDIVFNTAFSWLVAICLISIVVMWLALPNVVWSHTRTLRRIYGSDECRWTDSKGPFIIVGNKEVPLDPRFIH